MQLLGFRVGSVAARLKPSGKPDLACIVSDIPCSAAAVFTTNNFQAAPVILSRHRLQQSKENVMGVLINAGQANACTGTGGMEDAFEMVSAFESRFGSRGGVGLAMSTGVIGQRVDVEKVKEGLSKIEVDGSFDSWEKLSRAIMTTDTVNKMFYKSYDGFSVMGVAKGSGMIHPNMATMLSVLCTDAQISSQCLQTALKYSVDRSFNSIDVDGDTSTNDTVMVLANGASKSFQKVTTTESPQYQVFQEALLEASVSLAQQVVRDGEGATKFLTIQVDGATTREDASTVAKTVAQSSLFKCAMFGGDPNWGRILCAVGYSPVAIDVSKVDLFLECHAPQRQIVQIVSNGEPVSPAPKSLAEYVVKQKDITVRIKLNMGEESSVVWGTDLSYDYVRINAEYTT